MGTVTSNTIALGLALLLSAWTLAIWHRGSLRALLALHNLAWILALLVLGSNVVHFTPDSLYAWGIISLGIAAYNVAVVIAASSPPVKSRATVGPLMTKRVAGLLVLIYTIGLVGYVRRVASVVGSYSAFLHNPSEVRILAGQVNTGLSLPFKLALYLGPFLLAAAFNRWTIPGLRRRWRLLLIAYLLGTMLLGEQRTTIFTAALWEISIVLIAPPTNVGSRLKSYVASRRRRALAIAGSAIIAVGLFQFLAVILKKTGSNVASVQANVSSSLRGSSYSSLFIYLSGGIPSLSNLVDSNNTASPPPTPPGQPVIGNYDPQTWGRATFEPVFKLVPVVQPWNSVAPFTRIPFEDNVYTWLEPYYRDFRAIGVGVLTFASGLLVGVTYRLRRRSAPWTFLAALLLSYTALAPFANRFVEVFTYEYVALLMGLHYLGLHSRRRSRPLISSELDRTVRHVGRQVLIGSEAGSGSSRLRSSGQ